MLYIHPDECIDCGACVPACPVEAIFALDETPEKWNHFIPMNAEYLPESLTPGEWVAGPTDSSRISRVGPCGRCAVFGSDSNARVRAHALALLVGGTWSCGRRSDVDTELQYQLGTLLYDETRYPEALQSFDQAAQTTRTRDGRSAPVRARFAPR